MSDFDRLHPAVQHHIVNSLEWRGLRPLQAQAVGPVLDGEHALLIAPTAGGKTEAAILPILSRMLSDDWRGLTVLYLCPLRALLNNLHVRLEHYATLVGRRCEVWHGDTGGTVRDSIVSEPPDMLLTTPESLESMLVSSRVDHERFFDSLRVVVVDEIHAFASDDRGWHLLATIERVQRLAGRPLQRLGLSATVGNPDELLEWLTTTDSGPRRVVAPAVEGGQRPEITVDYVGNLANAATVISRLHRGEKRLVFVDSRARVEQLAVELRARSVDTYVSHGSLGREERRRAESAFAESRDCVIVATSTLELGIDVGDLDRVIQVDAPSTVASFMQRLGRTGRRSGSSRNCLFLTTTDDAFLFTAGLLRLWSTGFVEPTVPPALPVHIAAQQAMALALQCGGIGRSTWTEWLGVPFVLGEETHALIPSIVDHMVETGILFDDEGVLGIGEVGEAKYGRRYFSDLLSVFTTAPMFTVLHGRTEVGQVPDTTFELSDEEPRVFLLGGRPWAVTNIDWRRRVVQVQPTEKPGRARWFGTGQPLGFEQCRAIRAVLTGTDVGVELTTRGVDKLDELREAFRWLGSDGTAIVKDEQNRVRWWTFAGLLANAWLAQVVAPLRDQVSVRDNLYVGLRADVTAEDVRQRLSEIDWTALHLGDAIDTAAISGLKFDACVPEPLALHMIERRLSASDALTAVREEPIQDVQFS